MSDPNPPLAVAFLRNVNLGHRGSPTRAQLEDAFRLAGATDVVSFQTNGTVIHRSADPQLPAAAVRRLQEQGCADTVAFRMSAADLLTLRAGLTPPDQHPGAYRELLTFFDPAHVLPDLPEDSPRLTYLASGPGWVHSVSWMEAGQAGSPGPQLERLLRAPATTRTRGTLDRLAGRLLAMAGPPGPEPA